MNTPAKLIIVMVAVAASAAIGFRTLGPATTAAPPNEKAERKEKAPDNRAEQDEHGADRIYITDVKLAAGGVVFVEAGPATLSDTLQFNGVLRANQEAVVQVTPRFPGIVRAIRKRIGDTSRQGRAAGDDREQPEPHRLRPARRRSPAP